MIKTKVAIVGAGIAGLSLAMELEQREISYALFESSDSPGGLCKSWPDIDGVWHDYGPHIFHNKAGFDWFLDLLPNAKLLPRNDDVVLADEGVVLYPVQTACQDLIKPNSDLLIRNYKDYCNHHFGEELSRLFFMPWNYKVFHQEIVYIDVSVTGRTPAVGQPPGTYLYPANGKFSTLPEAMTRRLGSIHYCAPVTALDAERHYIMSTVPCQYDVLIWCAPLRQLLCLQHMKKSIFFQGVDLRLITSHAAHCGGNLPGLARYYANQTPWHRVSYEGILKNADSPYLQFELNADWDYNLTGINEFIIPDAYIVPTVAWIQEQTGIAIQFADSDIILHGRAGTGLHKNVWPIIQESDELARKLH